MISEMLINGSALNPNCCLYLQSIQRNLKIPASRNYVVFDCSNKPDLFFFAHLGLKPVAMPQN